MEQLEAKKRLYREMIQAARRMAREDIARRYGKKPEGEQPQAEPPPPQPGQGR